MTYDVYYQQNPFNGRHSENTWAEAHHKMNYKYDNNGWDWNPPVNY